jgi:5'-3' exonuclease
MSTPRLYLIDGSSQMYRAYHAIRGLTGPDGKSTNAVYGFVTMLRKLINDHQPQYIAASFDLAGPTFRSELATDYKANRTPMPGDLAEQIPWVHEACEALGVPILTSRRFEADDVIGTLATKAAAQGFEVAIVTGDKDFFQLVHDGIKVYNPKEEGTWYDGGGVKEKFGVAPSQVVDVLALMGDSIDNIKGVPGIGEKGARDLIATYGTLDELLSHASEVANKRQREGLLNHADDARQSRVLAQIHTDCPVDFDPDALRYRGASQQRCFELFSRLGFRSLVMEFAPTAQTVGKDYSIVDTIEGVKALVAELREATRFGFRVLPDTPSAMRAAIVGLSFSTKARHARYIPLAGGGLGFDADLDPRAALDVLKPLLEDPSVGKIGHDLKFDAIMLKRHGITLDGLLTDTMLASYLIDATRSEHILEDLALEYTGYKALTDEDVCGRGAKAVSFAQIPVEAALDYAGERSDLALQVSEPLRQLLKKEDLERVYEQLEHPLIPVLIDIERAGIRIDGPALASQSQNIDEELNRLAARVYEFAGEEFNINSPKKLGEILFDKMGLKTETLRRTTKTKAHSTAFEVLEELAIAHEMPRLVLEWRALMKLKGTYVLQPGGRGHRPLEQQRSESAEHPDPDRARARDPAGIRRRPGQRAHLGGLLADRVARARASLRRRGAHRRIHARRGHSRSDRAEGVRSEQHPQQARAPPPREDHQLRAAVRKAGVFAREGHRRLARRGAGLHQRVLRRISVSPRVHRRPSRRSARDRRREDPVRAPPAGAEHQQQERAGARRRRARDLQHANPGHRGRHSQAGDDRRARLAAPHRRRPRAHDPHRSRRVALRGAESSRGRNRRRGARADAVGCEVEGAAHRRRRHR